MNEENIAGEKMDKMEKREKAEKKEKYVSDDLRGTDVPARSGDAPGRVTRRRVLKGAAGGLFAAATVGGCSVTEDPAPAPAQSTSPTPGSPDLTGRLAR